MTLLIWILILYVLPAYLNYRWVRIAYSKGGINQDKDGPEGFDLTACLFPVVNVAAMIILWLTSYPRPKPKRAKPYNKFFRIK